MEKLIKLVGTAILGTVMIAFVAVIGGTILWIVWPAAISIFPAAIEAKYIVAHIAWWQAVCLMWFVALLIKSAKPTAEVK